MTRFSISLSDGVDMVLHALETAWGGEVFVPKIPSYSIVDVAKAIGPNCTHRIVGIRPGEKIHEEMITSSDSFTTYDLGKYYVILPQVSRWKIDDFVHKFSAKRVKEGFTYNSGENSDWLTIEDIRTLINKHVNPNFKL